MISDSYFVAGDLDSPQVEQLLSMGYRHFGNFFFTYSSYTYKEVATRTICVRVRADVFALSKSQRRILRNNRDLIVKSSPLEFRTEHEDLYYLHSTRFSNSVHTPYSAFFSDNPSQKPCPCRMFEVFEGTRLVAVSFMDILPESTSAVYAFFDPGFEARSLGIFTILLELAESRRLNKKYYYLGLATIGSTHYDYKKRFSPAEYMSFFDFSWSPSQSFYIREQQNSQKMFDSDSD